MESTRLPRGSAQASVQLLQLGYLPRRCHPYPPQRRIIGTTNSIDSATVIREKEDDGVVSESLGIQRIQYLPDGLSCHQPPLRTWGERYRVPSFSP